LNVGFGSDVTIFELANAVALTVGYNGEIGLDSSRPDGPPRKLMDSRRLQKLGWQPQVGLTEGLAKAYEDFLETHE